MTRHRNRIALLVVAAAIAVIVAGCGFGAGPGTKDASVEVTSGFGSKIIGSTAESSVPGGETVMSLLKRHFSVLAKHGSGSVESIDGQSGDSDHSGWFYYVNGILASKGAAATDVHKGDHIWWDLHDRVVTSSIPAVVGSYPEPFTNGLGGQEFPTVLDCAADLQSACNTVGASLHMAGVKAADQALGTGSGSDSLAVVVGTWNEIKGVIAAELIAGGPADSGVYAQFVGGSGQALELYDPLGDVTDTLRGNVGLIAATDEVSLGQPTWFVTGTDVAAVKAAAAKFTTRALHNHFAVVVQGSRVVPVPVLSGR